MGTKTEALYEVVNIYGDPIGSPMTLTEAETQCRKDWANGWETYHRPVKS